jgi:hypothetical protein
MRCAHLPAVISSPTLMVLNKAATLLEACSSDRWVCFVEDVRAVKGVIGGGGIETPEGVFGSTATCKIVVLNTFQPKKIFPFSYKPLPKRARLYDNA